MEELKELDLGSFQFSKMESTCDKRIITKDLFQSICRSCLLESNSLMNVFEVCTPVVYQYCTTIEINEDDELPKGICEKCLDLIISFNNFKGTAINSDGILKAVLKRYHEESRNSLFFDKSDCESDENIFAEPLEFENEDKQEEVPRKRRGTRSSTARSEVSRKSNVTKIPKVKKKPVRAKPPPKKDRLTCPKCKQGFLKYETLEAHMRKHFGKKPDIQCEICKKKFTSMYNLNQHLKLNKAHKGQKDFTCQTCGKKFGYLNVLKIHEKIHTGEKKYACEDCGAKFIQHQNLKNHQRIHRNEKPYECTNCGKKFSQIGNLKSHMLRHGPTKDYACAHCDMKFHVKSDLDKHRKTHSDEKPYACMMCDKAFKTRSFLTIHIRNHTGERPFACEFCPMKFKANRDLRHHRMTHTGEKPNKCPLCPQAFIQKTSLNRHLKSHNNKSVNVQESQHPSPAVSTIVQSNIRFVPMMISNLVDYQ